ncbi:phosphoribosylaminoimidazolesuccinocarboxamide synthase [candidate division KSB1 bacterium]|nr:phosphoribosylaminoimidazolesuccinocarboxamide synthase [candidate division KSB1 bacterium]
MSVITQLNCPRLNFLRRGKVREIYDFGDRLLIVATDRISAFDFVMPNGIPQKGQVLTQLSRFWFGKTEQITKNHLISTELAEFPSVCLEYKDQLEKRSMLVIKTEPLLVECIVRGYISGSGWKDYKRTGAISGIELPQNLQESDRLAEPIFTPSTKSDTGHDENISYDQMVDIIGAELSQTVKERSIEVYNWARSYGEERGIIIADTKFEFGERDGEIYLIDEVLTPDSSRFWPMDQYQPGRAQMSFDKQYVRDYLESIGWEKQPPVPELPANVVKNTSAKYTEALRLLSGETL